MSIEKHVRALVAIGMAGAALSVSAAAGDASSIGYPDVVTALLAVQKDPDAVTDVQDGWSIIQTKKEGKTVLWSFTQKGHPAHPSAVKRTLVPKDGSWDIQMEILCEAPKAECDKLAGEFKSLNEQMVKSLQSVR